MIEIQEACKTYGPTKALQSLTLTVNPGEVLGLLGPNGAGKTTTIHILAGFIQPDSGSVVIDGVDVVKDPDGARRRIGYIPENVALYPFLSASENLIHFAALAEIEFSASEATERLVHAGLASDAIHRRVSTFSKGMRQKVGIAIANSKGAKALILDEPASGLDPHASHELSMLVRKAADDGAAVLMATHDLFRAKETCDRVVILRSGLLVQQLDPKSMTANDLEKIYLDEMKVNE
ncbi:MAG: ABC-2 type transport system ATP-binding protein [Planctomycetota bacterium]|jgi:ABC-2 type transport system ATP-binding protein